MTVPLFVRATPLTHPALLPSSPTPPATPCTPVKSHPVKPLPGPVVDYALLRSHHAYALRYVIAKLRWEQTHNDYIRGEDAWLKHIKMIQKLEVELKNVEAACAGLDQWASHCFAPTAFPAAHGPPSKEQQEEEKRKAQEKQRELDRRLDAQFPFILKLFIGPMTKQQARNDRCLREALLDCDFDDLSVLLPSENLRMLMEGGAKREGSAAGMSPPPGHAPAHGEARGPKKTYEERRMEKESAKIARLHHAHGHGAVEPHKAQAAPIGPMTKEEWAATLPVAGPKTKGQALLPEQREQRHVILTFLRKPWPEYDEEAAGLMAELAKLAMKRLSAEAKEVKERGKAAALAGGQKKEGGGIDQRE